MFYDGTGNIGTGTLSAGKATLATSALTVDSHSITAVYGGDSNFTGSTSAALTQAVSRSVTEVFAGTANFAGSSSSVLNQRVADFSISATPSTQSVKRGKTAAYR